MKVEYINPFIVSTVNTFSTMLALNPVKIKMYVKTKPQAEYDVSAVIGLSGKVCGGVTISFPKHVALKVVSKFVGEEIKVLDRDVADGVGELVNIISGGAKSELNKMDLGLQLALPNVIMGRDHTIWQTKDTPCIVVLFECEVGNFSVEVSLKEM